MDLHPGFPLAKWKDEYEFTFSLKDGTCFKDIFESKISGIIFIFTYTNGKDKNILLI